MKIILPKIKEKTPTFKCLWCHSLWLDYLFVLQGPRFDDPHPQLCGVNCETMRLCICNMVIAHILNLTSNFD